VSDGIFIEGRRPKTKKQVHEAIAAGARIEVELTRLGCEETLDASQLVADRVYYIVGPDPYTKRSWYGQLVRKEDGRLSFR
jgi:hypothetical protein